MEDPVCEITHLRRFWVRCRSELASPSMWPDVSEASSLHDGESMARAVPAIARPRVDFLRYKINKGWDVTENAIHGKAVCSFDTMTMDTERVSSAT